MESRDAHISECGPHKSVKSSKAYLSLLIEDEESLESAKEEEEGQARLSISIIRRPLY